MVTSHPTWQGRLECALPKLEPILRARFKALGPEECEEAMQEALSYIADTMAHKPRVRPFQLLGYAIRRFFSGRRMAGDCARSIDSPYSRNRRQAKHDRQLNVDCLIGPEGDPAETVPCKIDFRDFRFSLSTKNAAIIDLAIEGETNGAIANIVNVSIGRVSQVKREAYDRWRIYCRM